MTMIVKYNRVSTLQQTGNRFSVDDCAYDLTLLDKVSGTVPFKERPQGKVIMKMIDEGKITELVVEDFSRLGRNTGDTIKTLEYLESKQINVHIHNIGLQSHLTVRKMLSGK